MKLFDLEAAKAGKPFAKKSGWKDSSRKFLGVMSNGDIAYEFKDPHGGFMVAQAHPDQLFMIAEKKTYTVCLVKMHSGYIATIKKEHFNELSMISLGEHTFEYEE